MEPKTESGKPDDKGMNLFHLAWPIFVSNILTILLGFIDIFVLSKVSDLAASAVSTACQITSICALIFSVVCSASGVMVSQCLGKGKREKASEITALCIVLNVIMGLVISTVVFLFHDNFLHILGAKRELFDMASVYITILSGGIILDAYQSSLVSVLYSHGKTKITMYISATMGILNLILDWIMVLGLFGVPRMEVRGAAYATLITKVVYAVLLSCVFFARIESLSVIKLAVKAKRQDVEAIFKLGIPSVFDSVNYNITQLVITGIIFHSLSENDIIARTYLMNIAAFFQLFTGAIASASQIMVGHEIGAGNYKKADRVCMDGMKISVVATGIVCIIAVIFSNQLFSIFTQNEEVIRIGAYVMVANVFVELGRAVNVVFVWSLRGAGDVSIPVLMAVCCMWIIAVGGSWLVVRVLSLGIVGIWVTAGIDEGVRGIIMYKRWKSKKWMNKCLV